MKAFFEEYGFVLIAVIVVVALIVLAKSVGTGAIGSSVNGWIDTMGNVGSNAIGTIPE